MSQRTFCCCLPTRLAVLLLSPVTLVASAFLAAVEWYFLHQIAKDPDSPLNVKIATVLLGGIMSVLALASFFGLIGSIAAKHGAVAFYSGTLWFCWSFATVIGIFNLVITYIHGKDSFTKQCTDPATGITDAGLSADDVIKVCQSTFNVVYGIACGVFAVVVLITLYLAVIVGRYRQQLAERKEFKYLHNRNASHSSVPLTAEAGYGAGPYNPPMQASYAYGKY
ncbi:hypothetical protein IE81DRAFT_319666 [Ceraceosorus guamensis]|uniref:Uncharacterized protein n=1 Tax=Ceraceosorus guamensis TaxID=1522189 RepID=A0A316W7I5_9BASI|nr:hypothetical protein IE81DRAFT_319666 [Ceraceosorus guamensis]PWN45829.1 hypothetical protein IE81DRAFT_319666 [Ceraceosorus guamensis]